LINGISRLKAEMAESDFDRYINSLTSMKKHGDTIFLITRNPRYKSVIEMKFIKQITECFGVSGFRVMVMPF
jgi:chromosomal replication initiation ATPase DnaA